MCLGLKEKVWPLRLQDGFNGGVATLPNGSADVAYFLRFSVILMTRGALECGLRGHRV